MSMKQKEKNMATKSKAKAHNVEKHNTPKGKIYDKKIRPLMDKILKICEKNKIPIIADIQLEDEHVLSSLIGGFMGGGDRQFLALAILAPELPGVKQNADLIMKKKLTKMMGDGNPLAGLLGALMGKPPANDPLASLLSGGGPLGGLLPPMPSLEELTKMPECPNGKDCPFCKEFEDMIAADEKAKKDVIPPQIVPPSQTTSPDDSNPTRDN